ncbi:hypothetical protein WME97_14745 [Sorangium sp. So ce367]
MAKDCAAGPMQALLVKLYAEITGNGNIEIPRNPTSEAASACTAQARRR